MHTSITKSVKVSKLSSSNKSLGEIIVYIEFYYYFAPIVQQSNTIVKLY